jgi:hypothetical protein
VYEKPALSYWIPFFWYVNEYGTTFPEERPAIVCSQRPPPAFHVMLTFCCGWPGTV